MSNYPIENSSEIFAELAKTYGSDPITDHSVIACLLDEFKERLGGWVILDFLDADNWDCIEDYELDTETGLLMLIWHDYRDRDETEMEREVRSMVFPASLYACLIHVNSVTPVMGKDTAVFVINGYAKTQKEIKKILKAGSDEFLLKDSSFFEKRVVRRIDGRFECYDVHCTPIHTMAIVPKQSGITAWRSKRFLYQYNLHQARDRIEKCVTSLDEMDVGDIDTISEKVNTVRRSMEYVLKVECCANDIALSKSYSQVLLGDLISKIKPGKESHVQFLLGKFAELANAFSHDSGKPLSGEDAKMAVTLALAYSSLVQLELD